jgi:hypothetical protein
MSILLSEASRGAHCWSSVHYRVLAHKSSLDVVEDDKFDRLIDPSVAEAELNTLAGLGDGTVPQTAGELDSVRGFLGVKADDECRGMNGVNDVGVVGVGTEVLVVLRRNLSEKGTTSFGNTHLGPDISIRRGQCPDGRVFVGCVIQNVFNLPVEGLDPTEVSIGTAHPTSLNPASQAAGHP